MTLSGCAQPVLGVTPEGKYPLLKRFKAAANREMARMDLAYKNIDSMLQVSGDTSRRKAIAKDDYERLQTHHARLKTAMKEVQSVREELDNDALKAAFEEYVQALQTVADLPAGELTDEMISNWQDAAGNLEPLVD